MRRRITALFPKLKCRINVRSARVGGAGVRHVGRRLPVRVHRVPLGRARRGTAVAADTARIVVGVVGAVSVHSRAAAVVGRTVAAAVGVIRRRVHVRVARAGVCCSVRALGRAEASDAVCAAISLTA